MSAEEGRNRRGVDAKHAHFVIVQISAFGWVLSTSPALKKTQMKRRQSVLCES